MHLPRKSEECEWDQWRKILYTIVQFQGYSNSFTITVLYFWLWPTCTRVLPLFVCLDTVEYNRFRCNVIYFSKDVD